MSLFIVVHADIFFFDKNRSCYGYQLKSINRPFNEYLMANFVEGTMVQVHPTFVGYKEIDA